MDEFVYGRVARIKSGWREASMLPKLMVMESGKMIAESSSVELNSDEYRILEKAVWTLM